MYVNFINDNIHQTNQEHNFSDTIHILNRKSCALICQTSYYIFRKRSHKLILLSTIRILLYQRLQVLTLDENPTANGNSKDFEIVFRGITVVSCQTAIRFVGIKV